MFLRFLRLRDKMIQAFNSFHRDILVRRTLEFWTKVEQYVDQLKERNILTLFLQRRGQSMSDFRLDIDILHSTVATNHDNGTHFLFSCNLGHKYISPVADTVCDKKNESGSLSCSEASILS